MIRRALACTVMAASMAASMATGPAATAGVQSTTCTSQNRGRLDPGLTTSSADQSLRGHGTLSACSGGGVTSGTVRGRGHGSGSCFSFSGGIRFNITWDTAETSKGRIRFTIDNTGAAARGQIVSGKFAGEPISLSNVSFSILEGDCTSGVTKAELDATVSL